jgi:DNA modification methylase
MNTPAIFCRYSDLKPTDSLVEHPKNALKHPETQLKALARVIELNGWRVPIVVSKRSGFITKGHGRLQAAKLAGWPQVPVEIQDYENEAAEYSDAIADNRIAELAEWDNVTLAEVLELLQKDNAMPEQRTGFTLEEIAGLIMRGKAIEENADEVPEAPQIAKTIKGDLYEIGRHRLLCGDSTMVEDVKRLMNGQVADLVFTDPPYRMANEGGSSQPIGRAAAKLGEKVRGLCDFDPVAFLKVLPSVFKDGTMNAYVFCNKDLVPDYLKWCLDAGFSFNILFWKKPSAIPLGGQHRPDVEYLLLFRKAAIWNNGLQEANYSKCLEYGRETGDEHPTKKPVELVRNEIIISSSFNGTVLDLFGGSGTTMVAAQQSGRGANLMELEPIYCDVAVTRMHKLYPELPIKLNGNLTDWR